MSLTKQRKLLIPQCFFLLRHLSAEPTPHVPSEAPPPLQDSKSSLIAEAISLFLQTPHNEWKSCSQLNSLLFSSSPTPSLFFQISRGFPSSSQALTFFNYIKSNSISQHNTQLLSYTFQAIFELASREPDSHNKLCELYKECKDQNVPLSINAATLLIRRFGRANMVDQSLLVYKELEPNVRNTHIRNVLIDVVLRDGRFDDALNVLEQMLQRDSEFPPDDVTGNIVFYALTRKDRIRRNVSDEEIVSLVNKFGEHGVFPNMFWLTQMISRLCRNVKTCLAWNVFHDLMKLGAPIEVAPCNALLTGLGKVRDFEKMNQLLLEMKETDMQPDVVTFGILINWFCKSWRIDEALEVFEKMSGSKDVEPDLIIYNTLIDGFCKAGKVEEGLRLMERMRSSEGCKPNVVTYNCLIHGFCKAGNIESGQEIFDQMKEEGVMPNVITLNSLIDGMCRHGRISSAVQFFKEMMRKGLHGNAVTYKTLINAFCNVNNIQEAMEWFHEMCQAGCFVEATVYYDLISGLCQAGSVDDASIVLSKLKEAGVCPDSVCYNVLIGAFCKKKMLDEAYEMFKEMEAAEIRPDCIAYNTLISCFCKAGNFLTACRVMEKMLKDDLVPTVDTYRALILSYCLQGREDEAMKIFRDMTELKVAPNTVIYNVLIDSLCKNNQVELALCLMDDMEVKGVKPNTATFNAMFKGLRKKNMLDKALKLMDKMIEHGCNPDYISTEILTKWLSKFNENEKLKNFVPGYKVLLGQHITEDCRSLKQ
ncbi:pentatricopeptide repeat-containing protein At3g61520, mitochondrial-like [Mangifera indica]|uniref:pentatricopeptide repeat-containing protein At3g61520, mitochondrial-like n=1 Tax=Mangifera indica TaxID=29780 RepID=UPI001CFA56DC|nr:pentatricopeptide repeat-containing protein At3g61520, mitochondrial-like [Mangifera indica]XP_044491207.1 pentatricopeptide repeat-containing protein At3g61520, mitochondrial-like [Mangifera indica]